MATDSYDKGKKEEWGLIATTPSFCKQTINPNKTRRDPRKPVFNQKHLFLPENYLKIIQKHQHWFSEGHILDHATIQFLMQCFFQSPRQTNGEIELPFSMGIEMSNYWELYSCTSYLKTPQWLLQDLHKNSQGSTTFFFFFP